ncbi:glycosyltransferase family 2 protein [Evansella tamaricis]|uniref:Glycosyltransferase family 2 protein n=1 Tax=Evansella tamaricis TaxID=2069301 RepID=A0ABS6JI63_9BACI|nr:glycosyltransferase family 2 protein [Evansella tamaricis]MBU9713331.1 glycosyltransferase family 2 protein [Evansella tamaricis]
MVTSYRLSVNIIVKNAESTIQKCLDSIVEVADEIIIVDTGSTDQTVSVIDKYPVNLFHMDWNDNFSDARNKALSQTTGDWVYIIDSDEILQSNRKHFDELMFDEQAEAYWIKVENIVEQSTFIHKNIRFFRNRPTYRFQGRIHEQILPTILEYKNHSHVQESSINILHKGYDKNYKLQSEKQSRNKRLLIKELKVNNDPFLYYNLALEHLKGKHYKKVITFLKPVFAWKKNKCLIWPMLISC